MPILSRFGCNSSGCHGNAEGQNGFKLSVFGFDPPADHTSLLKESRGRRIFYAAPELSLLLTKPSGQTAHGGGIRIRPESPEYELLRGWIAAGTPFGEATAPHVASIRVEPKERLMTMKAPQQLRVIARFSDGREVDVTAHARFQANQEAVANVDPDGLVTAGQTPGEAAIMASYMNSVDTFRALVPRPETIAQYPPFPEKQLHRRPGVPQAEEAEHRSVRSRHRCGVRPPGLPGRDRHSAHSRRGPTLPGGQTAPEA